MLPIAIVLAVAALVAAVFGPMVQDAIDGNVPGTPQPTAVSQTHAPTATPWTAMPTQVVAVTAAPATPAAAVTPDTVTPAPAVRIIDIEATGALELLDQAGAALRTISVTPGEQLLFRVSNTAGYQHSFWIGPRDRLQSGHTIGCPASPPGRMAPKSCRGPSRTTPPPWRSAAPSPVTSCC